MVNYIHDNHIIRREINRCERYIELIKINNYDYSNISQDELVVSTTKIVDYIAFIKNLLKHNPKDLSDKNIINIIPNLNIELLLYEWFTDDNNNFIVIDRYSMLDLLSSIRLLFIFYLGIEDTYLGNMHKRRLYGSINTGINILNIIDL